MTGSSKQNHRPRPHQYPKVRKSQITRRSAVRPTYTDDVALNLQSPGHEGALVSRTTDLPGISTHFTKVRSRKVATVARPPELPLIVVIVQCETIPHELREIEDALS